MEWSENFSSEHRLEYFQCDLLNSLTLHKP